MFELIVTSPEGAQSRHLLRGDTMSIGREEASDILLADARVSRTHARLRRRPDDSGWTLEDAGSANGVLVGGRSIAAPTAIFAGMVADLSGFQLRFVAPPKTPDGRAGGRADAPLDGRETGMDHASAAAGSPGIEAFGMALLAVAEGGGDAGVRHLLAAGPFSVGREADNQLVLDDLSLSRHHALLTAHAGGVQVKDLGSGNGTFVDGQKIDAGEVAPGQTLAFGKLVFRLVQLAPTPDRRDLPAASINEAPARRGGWPLYALVGGVALAMLGALGLAIVRPWQLHDRPGGLGPGADERAFVATTAALMQQADAQFQGQLWASAEDSYEAVLAHDPLAQQARTNLVIAQNNRVDAGAVALAHQAMQRGDAAGALAAAEQVQVGHFYRPAAEAIGDQAREGLAKEAQEAGNQACRRGRWQACYGSAATLLMYRPREPAGLALANEALDAMLQHRLPFAALGIAPHPAMAKIYPDSEVRQAIWRYSAGDLQLAGRRLRTFAQRPGAAAAARQLAALRAAQAEGDRLAVGGHLDQGMARWERALALDRELTAGGPSVVGSQLRRQLATQYLHQGSAAFDRGALPAALTAWQQGLRADPEHLELPLQLARLEARGRQILDMVAQMPALDGPACAHLHEVVAFVPPGSGIYLQAQEHLKMCHIPHGPGAPPSP